MNDESRLGGRLPENSDCMDNDSTGTSPSEVSAPLSSAVTGGASAPRNAEDTASHELVRTTNPVCNTGLSCTSLRLDRLTVRGRIAAKTNFQTWLQRADDITPATPVMQYQQAWSWNGLHISIGTRNSGAANSNDEMVYRIDFNPSDPIALNSYYAMLPSTLHVGIGLELPGWITRYDLATDYTHADALDLNTYRIDRTRSKIIRIYGELGDLQTCYLGAPTSDLRIRVYNKRLEQIETGNTDPGYEWTRIEAQIRRTVAINPIDQTLTLEPRPFTTLDMRQLPTDATTDDMVAFYDPSYLRNKTGNTRISRKKRLERFPSIPHHPQALYDEHRDEISTLVASIALGSETERLTHATKESPQVQPC